MSSSNEAQPSTGLEHAPHFKVPSAHLIGVEHPFLVKDIEKCVQSLGGAKNVQPLVDDASSHIPTRLNLRPQDPYSRSIESCIVSGANLLMRFEVPRATGRKRKRGSTGPFVEDTRALKGYDRHLRSLRDNPGQSTASVVGRIKHTHRFRDPPDFVWSTSTSKFLSHAKDTLFSGSYSKISQFKLDTENKDAELIPPPVITPTATPWVYSYRQNVAVKTVEIDGLKRTFNSTNHEHRRIMNLRSNAAEVPNPSKEDVSSTLSKLSTPEQKLVARIQHYFGIRPVWTRRGIRNVLRAEGMTHQHLEAHLLAHVAYTFADGPWRDALIRLGVDPRLDPETRIYQTMSFRMDGLGPDRQTANSSDSRLPPSSHRGQTQSRIKCPEPPAEQSHVFDGTSVDTTGKIWQVCDIKDALVQTILSTCQIRDTCDVKHSGWYFNGSWGKARAITKAKLRHLVDTGKPLDIKASIHVQQLLQIPDQITEENWDEVMVRRTTKNQALARLTEVIRHEARKSIRRDLNPQPTASSDDDEGTENGNGDGVEAGVAAMMRELDEDEDDDAVVDSKGADGSDDGSDD